MSNSSDETPAPGVSDEDLPEDLRPTEDNPLAQPLDEDVDTDDLDMFGGKGPEEGDPDEVEDEDED